MIKNNKGFSLIELIIVIAIMAVLIGILAPQYLKYVEKSRVASVMTDADNVANAISAILIDAAANNDDTYATLLENANGYTVNLGSSNNDTQKDGLASMIRSQVGTSNSTLDATVTFTITDDFPSFTYTMNSSKYAVDYNCYDASKNYIQEKGKLHAYLK